MEKTSLRNGHLSPTLGGGTSGCVQAGTELPQPVQSRYYHQVQLRSAVQPEYRTLKNRADALAKVIPSQEKQLTSLRADAKYNVPVFLLGIVFSFLSFILVIWIIGLFIEALYLGVHLAVDIHKIREQYEPKSTIKS